MVEVKVDVLLEDELLSADDEGDLDKPAITNDIKAAIHHPR